MAERTYPEPLSVAVVGVEPDYGFWVGRSGRAVVAGRVVAEGRGDRVARRLSDVPRPEHLDTTEGARAYAEALSGALADLGEREVGVDLLVMHEEDLGVGGWCIGSAGVWAAAPDAKRATPDRSVGAQLRAMNVAVDPRAEHLSTTRILADKVEGGDVFYAVGDRVVALIAWPLPDLGALPPAGLGGDAAEVLGTMVRLIERQCALGSGLVCVWDREPAEE